MVRRSMAALLAIVGVLTATVGPARALDSRWTGYTAALRPPHLSNPADFQRGVGVLAAHLPDAAPFQAAR